MSERVNYVRVNSERGYVLSRLMIWTAALLEHYGARRIAWRLTCAAPGVTPSPTATPGWQTTRTVRDPNGCTVHVQRRVPGYGMQPSPFEGQGPTMVGAAEAGRQAIKAAAIKMADVRTPRP